MILHQEDLVAQNEMVQLQKYYELEEQFSQMRESFYLKHYPLKSKDNQC